MEMQLYSNTSSYNIALYDIIKPQIDKGNNIIKYNNIYSIILFIIINVMITKNDDVW